MRHVTRPRLVALGLLLCLVLPASAARAVEPVFQDAGLAIRGYDPVDYFTAGRAVAGAPEVKATWNGATWRLASAANRDAFLRDPDRYTPRYGALRWPAAPI